MGSVFRLWLRPIACKFGPLHDSRTIPSCGEARRCGLHRPAGQQRLPLRAAVADAVLLRQRWSSPLHWTGLRDRRRPVRGPRGSDEQQRFHVSIDGRCRRAGGLGRVRRLDCLHGRDAGASSGRERAHPVGRRRGPASRRVVGFPIAAERGGGRPRNRDLRRRTSGCSGAAGRRTEPAGAVSH